MLRAEPWGVFGVESNAIFVRLKRETMLMIVYMGKCGQIEMTF